MGSGQLTLRGDATPPAPSTAVLRLRCLARRVRTELRFLTAAIGLLAAARTGRLNQLWIGDSHAVHDLDGHWPCPELRESRPGVFAWHIGPRLMYSLARDGYPRRVRTIARLLRVIAPALAYDLILVNGEIDVRCHLGPRMIDGSSAELGFPARFVERGRELARRAGAGAVIFVVPVPPSDTFDDAFGFPIRGTLAQRITAHGKVRAELVAAVAAVAAVATVAAAAARGERRVDVVDCTSDLADETGELRPEMTFDGCHVNEHGRQIVQAQLARVRAMRS